MMIPRNCRCLLVLAFALLPKTALAQAPLLEPIVGAFVLHGGGPVSDAVRERCIELAGGAKARLVIVPGKAENADPLKALDLWTKLPVASATVLDQSQAGPLANASGVWFEEGASANGDAAVRRELRK